jgi:hypothetical protein
MRVWIYAAALVSAASFAASAIAAEGGTESASPAASAAAAPVPPEEQTKAFIGAGIGTGTARYRVNGTTVSFSDRFQGSNDETPFIAVKVVSFGIAVKPNLFAGADLTGVAQSGTVGTNRTDLQISNYFASLTWFPWERGLFLKGAAGVSSLFIASGPSQSDRSWGLGTLVSAGFALRLSGAHHLTFSAEQGWQTYWKSSETRPDSSQYNAFFLGYMWKS